VHAELICCNPITGRKAWLLRHIPGGQYGDPWDAMLVVTRRHWFDKRAMMLGGEAIGIPGVHRKVRGCLAKLGFSYAMAKRHGRIKTYPVKTRRGA